MKGRESEKGYTDRRRLAKAGELGAHFASALIIIKGSQASTLRHGGIQQDKWNSFTLILSACVCAFVYVCTGEASSQRISSQTLFPNSLERHLRSSDGSGVAVNLLPLTQPPSQRPSGV